MTSQVYLYRGGRHVRRDAVRMEVHRSVTAIPDGLFAHCHRLESLLLHDGLLKIGERSFRGCSSLRSLRCPATVAEIGEGAFYGCWNLAAVDLPEGLESIEDLTFARCTSLEEIRIPSSVARIGDGAFYGCTNLASVKLREGLLWIGDSAFQGCTSLESFCVPSSVVEIRSRAFYGCDSLTLVRLHENLPMLGPSAFRGCLPESFQFVRLSERMEVVSMDGQEKSMFETRLSEMTHTLAGADHDEEEEAGNFWEKCKTSLGMAHEVLTYLELKGATPVMELAVWKAKIEGEGGEGVQRDLVDDEICGQSRKDCLDKCGAGIVGAEVLKFFAYRRSWPRLDG